MRYLHTMIRVTDVEASMKFFCEGLGMVETRRFDSEAGKFSLIYLAASEDVERAKTDKTAEIELTHNWDSDETYTGSRNFGHLAFEVEDIYALCEHLEHLGYTINRPPRDGWMAFVRTPDNISVEFLQKGDKLPPHDDWKDRENIGEW